MYMWHVYIHVYMLQEHIQQNKMYEASCCVENHCLYMYMYMIVPKAYTFDTVMIAAKLY